jgi:hypothetical protein
MKHKSASMAARLAVPVTEGTTSKTRRGLLLEIAVALAAREVGDDQDHG